MGWLVLVLGGHLMKAPLLLAAVLAAAMSAEKGCLPRKLKVADLQDALRADGVDLTRGGQSQEGLKSEG
jgi:hypothetical protein